MTDRRLAIAAIALIVVITTLHYTTAMHHVAFHDILRRLYYLPVVLAAFAGGVRGGLLGATVVCLAYGPHAFFMEHRDPSPTMAKVGEFMLYPALGVLCGWLVQQRDRARARVERALEERDALEQQLVRAGRLSALGHLSAGLAHEIRNPLASIQGSAEALAAEVPEGHRKHRMGQLLLREIGRLDRVMRGFLEFVKPSPPSRREVDLAERVRAVEQLVDVRARQDGVDHVEVPETVEDRWVSADADQVTQVLLNLALNGLDAIEAAAPELPRLAFRATEREVAGVRCHCVGVLDNGDGIAEADAERIFDPYFTTRAEGTGLGLSLSSRIMEAHDGFLDVERGDRETTVWACFPSIEPGVDTGVSNGVSGTAPHVRARPPEAAADALQREVRP